MRARYYWAATIAGFAIYTAIAILGSTSTLVYWRQAHYPFDAEAFLANRFLEQWTCALFVPALFWLTERFPIKNLPANWNVEPPDFQTMQIGDEWVRAGKSVALAVPSVLSASEMNFLLNPRHPDFKKIKISQPVEYRFDSRLLNR